jgi:hypothetical protein
MGLMKLYSREHYLRLLKKVIKLNSNKLLNSLMAPKIKENVRLVIEFINNYLDLYKSDPEGKSIMNHVLLNANDILLHYIINKFNECLINMNVFAYD